MLEQTIAEPTPSPAKATEELKVGFDVILNAASFIADSDSTRLEVVIKGRVLARAATCCIFNPELSSSKHALKLLHNTHVPVCTFYARKCLFV